MLRTRSSDGKIFDEIKETIKIHEIKTRSKVDQIGAATAKKMQDVINGSKVRPQAGEPKTLEDNINVEYYPGQTGWGVGNISLLDRVARYWRALNYGSKHLIGKQLPPGVFDPGMAKPDAGSSRAGRFKAGMHKGGSTYSPIIKNEIHPMNYITKTVNFVRREINKIRFGK